MIIRPPRSFSLTEINVARARQGGSGEPTADKSSHITDSEQPARTALRKPHGRRFKSPKALLAPATETTVACLDAFASDGGGVGGPDRVPDGLWLSPDCPRRHVNLPVSTRTHTFSAQLSADCWSLPLKKRIFSIQCGCF